MSPIRAAVPALLARALARSLYPGFRDDEIFFEVGAKNVPFEGYRGQPVVIWNDWRAIDFLMEFGGRGQVFDFFAPHPGSPRVMNIKNSSVVLTNPVNVVACAQNYADFFDALAGEFKDKQGVQHMAEDKAQAYRRWPVIIPMRTGDFDILLNRGWLDDTEGFEQYVGFKTVTANMRLVRKRLQDLEQIAEVERRIVAPIVEAHGQLCAPAKLENDEDVLRELESFGETCDVLSPDEMRAALADADKELEARRSTLKEEDPRNQNEVVVLKNTLPEMQREIDELKGTPSSSAEYFNSTFGTPHSRVRYTTKAVAESMGLPHMEDPTMSCDHDENDKCLGPWSN